MSNLVGAFTVEEIEQQALLENNKTPLITPISLDSIMAEELKNNQDLLLHAQHLREVANHSNLPSWNRVPLLPLNQLFPGPLPLMGQPNILGNNVFIKPMQAFTGNINFKLI